MKIIILSLVLIVGMFILLQPVPNCVDIPSEDLTTEKPVLTLTKQDVLGIYEDLEDGRIILQTSGDSMKGLIDNNQICACSAQEEYHIGDIILFLQDGVGILHEIVYETKNGFITKGTNNELADGEIGSTQALCAIEYIPMIEKW